MVQTALSLAADPSSIEILAYLDADDRTAAEYREECITDGVGWVIGPRKPVPTALDWLAHQARGDILMACADDILFRTRHWDKRVKAAFADVPDGMLVAFTNDGRDRHKCEHFFTTRRWVDAVGYFMPDCLEHFAGDAWVEDIAVRVGRLRYLRDVVTEHRHFKYGKAEFDETYRRTRVENMAGRDTERLNAGEAERKAAAERVRAVIGMERTEAHAASAA